MESELIAKGYKMIENRDDTVMSNLGPTIDDDAEELLKKDKVVGRHAGWDFNALVWFEDGEFHSKVFRYHFPVGQYKAPTLKELMTLHNDNHGWE